MNEGSSNNSKRLGIIIAVLALLVVGLGVALSVTKDDKKADTVTKTSTTVSTTNGGSTTLISVEDQAQREASAAAKKSGITLSPSQFKTTCSKSGGGYNCKVSANGGQCKGTINIPLPNGGQTRSLTGDNSTTKNFGCGE